MDELVPAFLGEVFRYEEVPITLNMPIGSVFELLRDTLGEPIA
jgi:hypothetical protein